MPYIKPALRLDLAPWADQDALSPGDLNYQITSLVDEYVRVNGLSYQSVNDAIGALECAKLELYRRVASPYEDAKLRENGDVYTTTEGAPTDA